MRSSQTDPVTVYFDGSCPLCVAEIDHFKRMDSNNRLNLIDVSTEEPLKGSLITRQAAMARFHVRLANGRYLSGAEGFIEVWRAIPAWRWLARFADIPGMALLLEFFYSLFLHTRPFNVRVFKIISRIKGPRKHA